MAPLFTLDPTLPHLCAALLAMVFLAGAWQKLRDMAALEMAIEQYRLLPAPLATVAAWGLVGAEVLAGALAVSLHRHTSGLDLAGRDARGLEGLEREVAERDVGATCSHAAVAALLHLPVLGSLGGKHRFACSCYGKRSGLESDVSLRSGAACAAGPRP